MTRLPQMDGETLADIITWVWNPATRRWSATLKDDIVIDVNFERRGQGKSYWSYTVDHAHGLTLGVGHFKTPTEAQDKALELVKILRDLAEKKP